MKNLSVPRYIFCLCFILLLFSAFVIKLIDWQIIHGEEYRAKSDESSIYNVTAEAFRGEIVDKNGKGLAINKLGFKVVFCKAYSKEETENKTIQKLIRLFNKKKQKWIDELPIKLEKTGEYAFKPNREADIEQMKHDYRLNIYATANDCIDMLASQKWFDCNIADPAEKRDVLSVKYNMNKNGYSNSTNYVFAETVSNELITIISEHITELPGIQIQKSSIRKYVNGYAAPHIIGSIGLLSKEEYEKVKDNDNYQLNSKIGKMGIEKYMEDYLVGTNGTKAIELSQEGVAVSEKDITPAVSGNTVFLTLDSNLQTVAKTALEKNVSDAQQYVANQVTGSVVMLDVNDFSVLCAQSYPTFDLNAYYTDKDYYAKVATDKSNPLFARAFEGSYTIGSTMKPAVALASLEEKVITPGTVFSCGHTYQRFAPSFTPVCMGTHGGLSLYQALAVSCNIYFFEAGYYLGINNMNAYQKRFGFGEKTGVEIYENTGLLAGPKERTDSGGTWYDGDTISAAIGQSDNLVTPIQLATYAATIANNGVRKRTHLIKKITDYSKKKVIFKNTASNIEVMSKIGASAQNWSYVKEAMRSVITNPSGTAHNIFGAYEIDIAGKTGTAENNDNSADHELFIAFAPYDKPKVAIAVIIEHGKTGVYPQNVAKAVLDEYFGLNKKDKKDKKDIEDSTTVSTEY